MSFNLPMRSERLRLIHVWILFARKISTLNRRIWIAKLRRSAKQEKVLDHSGTVTSGCRKSGVFSMFPLPPFPATRWHFRLQVWKYPQDGSWAFNNKHAKSWKQKQVHRRKGTRINSRTMMQAYLLCCRWGYPKIFKLSSCYAFKYWIFNPTFNWIVTRRDARTISQYKLYLQEQIVLNCRLF